MTVAIDWRPPEVGRAAPRPRHLRLVGSCSPTPVSSLVGASPAEVLPARRTVGALTRRGRLVRTLFVVTAVMVVAPEWHLPAGVSDPPAVDHSVSVRAGQTLSDIATEQLPGLPVSEGVRRLRIVNDLGSTTVYPGQTIHVPAAP